MDHMEVPARSGTLLMMMMMMMMMMMLHLSCAQDQHARVVPSSLQLFEYSPLSVRCDGFNSSSSWRVLRKRKGGGVSTCVSNRVTTTTTTTESVCVIEPAYLTDSGEYWCEEEGGGRSNTVTIIITAGPVILESPVLPVTVGEPVTLRCRSKMTSTVNMADFYKDGLHIGSGSTGEITMDTVSESDEGLYKCSISDFGESPQSRLKVRVLHRACEATPVSSGRSSCHVYLVLRTVFTVVMVALLLLIVGLLHRWKLRLTLS